MRAGARHLLPAVSHTRILIKASFLEALSAAPTLHVGASSVRGQMNFGAAAREVLAAFLLYAGDEAFHHRVAVALCG